jgi:hypothetical protein
MLTRRRFLGVAAAAGAAAMWPGLARPAQTNAFVRTRGTQLVAAGKPWPLSGASIYHASTPGGQGTLSQLAQWAQDGGLNTLRIVNFFPEGSPSAPTDPEVAPYDESSWRRVDGILAACRESGLRAILDLSVYRNCLHNWAYAHGETTTPYSRDWSRFIRFVVTRKNTVNHQPYRSDSTIALVSFAGEPNPPHSGEPLKPTTQELTGFYARVFAQWRDLDKNHLLSTGGLIHLDWEDKFGNPAGSGIDWQAIFALEGNDVPSLHNYTDVPDRARDFSSAKVGAFCAQLGKPWLTEEFGLPQLYADADRAAWFETVYDIQRDHGSAGVAFWNLGHELTPVGENPTTFDVSPQTPLVWDAVRANAPL